VVVAMPVQADYPLDPDLRALETAGAIRLLDFRRVEGINPSSYRDAIHLNRHGQRILSHKLAIALKSQLAFPL